MQEAPESELLHKEVLAESRCRLKAVYDSLHDFGPRSVQQDPLFSNSDLAMTDAMKWPVPGRVSVSSFLVLRFRTVNRFRMLKLLWPFETCLHGKILSYIWLPLFLHVLSLAKAGTALLQGGVV